MSRKVGFREFSIKLVMLVFKHSNALLFEQDLLVGEACSQLLISKLEKLVLIIPISSHFKSSNTCKCPTRFRSNLTCFKVLGWVFDTVGGASGSKI